MKILTAEQIRRWDEFTMKNEPVASIDLMERAAHSLFKVFTSRFKRDRSVDIFCGPGNNGGDGLVLARKLKRSGYTVRVFIAGFTNKYSEDFEKNLDRLDKTGIGRRVLKTKSDFPEQLGDIAVDAVFGSGLSRKVSGFPGEILEFLNRSDAFRVAVDIPSGLFAEDNDNNDGVIFKADLTYSFQVYKLAFMFAENIPYTGEIELIPIGLDPSFSEGEKTDFRITDLDEVRARLRKRRAVSHKGTYGHACIAAGGSGKMGAAVLAGKSCMRSGVGLLTMRVPKCGYNIIQTTLPEAMCIPDSNEYFLNDDIDYSPFNAIGIGPGIGTESETRFMLEELIATEDKPMVLDADALNLMVEFEHIRRKLPEGSILTPHPGEFKRLFGDHPPIERLEVMREFTRETGCYLVYKDFRSFVVSPNGKCFFNSTGNEGMATGGSGDVLTGLLTGLCAQGYDSESACVTGMYLHGLAGDLAVEEKHSSESLLSSDLIEFLAPAWRKVWGMDRD